MPCPVSVYHHLPQPLWISLALLCGAWGRGYLQGHGKLSSDCSLRKCLSTPAAVNYQLVLRKCEAVIRYVLRAGMSMASLVQVLGR